MLFYINIAYKEQKMPTLTKIVKLAWDSEISPPMISSADTIVADMVSQLKTDGVWDRNFETPYGGQMNFTDQTAAEEYIARMTAAGAAVGRVLIASSITDI
jgi:hypothetical protein